MSEEDGIEKVIGPFGKYQVFILILITIGRWPTEFQITNVVFILPSVDYVCLDEGAYNVSNHCPCKNALYDESVIVSSITSEWNLICDRTYLASLAQSVLQVGILIGSIIYGYVSDRYGRKPATLLSLFTTPVFVALSALMPSLWTFMFARFLIGTGVGGTMLCCYVLLVEFSGKSFRPYVVGLHEISLVTGYFFMAFIAYFVREWRPLQLVTSVPWLVVIIFYWMLPESPRWLITSGKKKEAIEILTRIAKRNNRPPQNVEAIVNEIEEQSLLARKQQTGTYLDLFRTPKIRVYTMINVLVWMFCSHTFFGVNQYIGRVQGNIYINVMLSAVFLIPGLFYVVISTIKFKRRPTIMFSFTLASMSLLVLIFVSHFKNSATLAFAIIGQTGAYASFVLTYLYASEIFPTVVRNSAFGLSSVFARLGSFIAPFVVNIQVEWISLLIFAIISFLAAILCFFLPETKGIVLLNSIEQREQSQKNEKTQVSK